MSSLSSLTSRAERLCEDTGTGRAGLRGVSSSSTEGLSEWSSSSLSTGTGLTDERRPLRPFRKGDDMSPRQRQAKLRGTSVAALRSRPAFRERTRKTLETSADRTTSATGTEATRKDQAAGTPLRPPGPASSQDSSEALKLGRKKASRKNGERREQRKRKCEKR